MPSLIDLSQPPCYTACHAWTLVAGGGGTADWCTNGSDVCARETAMVLRCAADADWKRGGVVSDIAEKRMTHGSMD